VGQPKANKVKMFLPCLKINYKTSTNQVSSWYHEPLQSY